MSRIILMIHTLLFGAFVIVSISSPFLTWFYGDVVAGKYVLVGAALLMVLVVGSWPVYGGCPFTVWENQYRKNENKEIYSGPCIDHYAAFWFGTRLPRNFSTHMLLALFALPIITSLWNW